MVKFLVYLQSRVYYAVCAILLFIMLIIPFTGPQSSIHGDFGDMARLPGYYSLIMMFNSGDWNIFISPNSELVNVWKVKSYGIVVGLLVMGLWILILASPVMCHAKKQKSLFIYIILALFSHLIWLLAEWADGVNSHVWLAPGEYLIIIPSFLFLAGFCSSYLMQETNSVKKTRRCTRAYYFLASKAEAPSAVNLCTLANYNRISTCIRSFCFGNIHSFFVWAYEQLCSCHTIYSLFSFVLLFSIYKAFLIFIQYV